MSEARAIKSSHDMFRHMKQDAKHQVPMMLNYQYQAYEPQVPIYPEDMKMAQINKTVQPHHYLPSQTMGLERPFGQASRPLCRCRVIYLGSSVPHKTKNGLHGIQDPLKSLYPEERFQYPNDNDPNQSPGSFFRNDFESSSHSTVDISHLSSGLGIDSWLSVWSNGLLLENVDELGREIKRFLPIESLHYCAAVRFFDTKTLGNAGPASQYLPQECEKTGNENADVDSNNNMNEEPNGLDHQSKPEAQNDGQLMNNKPKRLSQEEALKRKSTVKFLPLDAPLFQCPGMMDTKHPPVFSAIFRRTSGIKVLECHSFICRRDAAANALVRCCTHAYASLIAARQSITSVPTGLMLDAGGTLRSFGINNVGGKSRHSRSMRSTVLGWRRQDRHHSDEDDEEEDRKVLKQMQFATSMNHGQQLGSVGGTTSNDNTTNGTDPSSSGDDNYAIILKNNEKHKQQSSKSDEEDRHRSKGSSRSLFDNFQPRGSPSMEEIKSGHQLPPVTSHSLDILSNEARDGAVDTQAILQGKTLERRHSRSMQNLRSIERRKRADSPSYLVKVAGIPNHRSNYNRRHLSKRSLHKSGSKGPRSASCHDILMSQIPMPRPMNQTNNDYEELDVAPKSLSRSQHRLNQASLPQNSGNPRLSNIGTLSKSSDRPRRAMKPVDTAHNYLPNTVTMNTVNNPTQLYHPHPCYPAGPIGPPMYPVGPATIYVPNCNISNNGHTLPTRQLTVSNGANYYEPTNYYHPAFYPAPPPGPPHSYYPAHSLNQYQPALGAIPMNPAAFRLGPGSSATIVPQRRASKQQRHPRASYEYDLAARFRCLSPPANLLPDRGRSTLSKTSGAHKSTHPGTDGRESQSMSSSPIDQITVNSIVTDPPPFLPNPNGSIGFKGSSHISSNGNNSNGGGNMGTLALQTSDPKKLSWIKRLSLTLSSGSVESSIRNDPSGSSQAKGSSETRASAELNARNNVEMLQVREDLKEGAKVRRTKRSSLLFAGSLTLGRRSKATMAASKQEPQQQQQLQSKHSSSELQDASH